LPSKKKGKEKMAENIKPGSLFVGEGVVIKGNFDVPDMAAIAGLVEGELTTKQVMVDSSGVINGKVNAETVEVRGEITQGLSVTDHLTVYATGKITGTIEYSQISVEKGAHLTGDLKVISKPSY
jgi:cytoskeletal protein CcmA (bactofilin family)